MIVKVGHHLLEAYPVENYYVYEVSYCGRKEFYQDAWDAAHSTLLHKKIVHIMQQLLKFQLGLLVKRESRIDRYIKSGALKIGIRQQ